jgi:hypothetical protein
VNILNKQSRTADKGCSSSLDLGGLLTTAYRKRKSAHYEMLHRASDLGGFFLVRYRQRLVKDRDQ